MHPKAPWVAVLLVGVLPAQRPGKPAAHAPGPVPTPFPTQQALMLDGKPFPPVAPFHATLPPPRRTLFAAPGKEPGDGSEAHPWSDLQAALCALGPGDRLRVRAGEYPGGLRIAEPCRDGGSKEPIEVVFEEKARRDGRAPAPALSISRSGWKFVAVSIELKDSAEPGIEVGDGARDVAIDGARVTGGAGPSVRIERNAANVTVSNSLFAKTAAVRGNAEALGVDVAGGTERVGLVNDRFVGNSAGSVRIGNAVQPPARHVVLRGNTMRGDERAAIDLVSALDVNIVDNALQDSRSPEARAVDVGAARSVVIRRNAISGFPVAIRIGLERGGDAAGAEEVTVERNYIESGAASDAALDVESGRGIRFSNNVVAGYGPAVAVFGKPRGTRSIAVANNLFLNVSGTAFVVADPLALALFDYNIWAPGGAMPAVEFEGKRSGLDAFLKGGRMPHSSIARGVEIVQHDLARISGAQVVDRGVLLPGLGAKGSAPDVGVAEK